MKKMSFKKISLIIILIILVILSSISIYEKLTINKKYYINEKNLQIPVFVYHHIVEDEKMVNEDWMETPFDTFKKQINGLIKLGYRPISYKDLIDYKNGKKKIYKKSFLITFDDGYTDVYKYAFKYAREKNIPMTTFLINDKVGEPGYYTWEEAKEMHDSGIMGVYSHGYTHIKYEYETPRKTLELTNKSYNELTEKLNDKKLLKIFTYPYGSYNNKELKLLYRNGYIQNLTDNKINNSNNLKLYGIHRCYPLNDSLNKILLKIYYRDIRY